MLVPVRMKASEVLAVPPVSRVRRSLARVRSVAGMLMFMVLPGWSAVRGCDGAAGDLCEGGHAEVDGGGSAGYLVELGELGVRA